MTGALPGGAWRALLPRALTLIDEIRVHGGIADPFWTLGGGTVLMFRHRHRLSKDIDIFVSDPQYLGFVTPRLNNVAADMTADYTEQPSAWVKLQFEEGEVDFVASPNLLGDAWETWEIDGHAIRVETAAEIIAKKMFHRGDRVTARIAVSGSFGSIRRSPWRSRIRASVSARTAALYGTAFDSAVTNTSPEV